VATLYDNFERRYSQKKQLLTLTLGQSHSKSNRLVPGLCPTILYNFINIRSVVLSNSVNRQTYKQRYRHRRKHSLLGGGNKLIRR